MAVPACACFDEATKLAPGDHGRAAQLDGQWRVGGGRLAQGQGVWWADQATQWRLTPASRGARLLAVVWQRRSEI